MPTEHTLRHLTLALLTATGLGHASAQVFIPDQFERDWLNEQIPGIVDGAGIMDTLHPDIPGLDTAYWTMDGLPTDLELHGIGHLDALEYLSMGTDEFSTAQSIVVHMVSAPASLTKLIIGMYDIQATGTSVHLHLPQLPPQMDRLELEGWFGPVYVTIDAMPSELGQLILWDIEDVAWQGAGHVDQIDIQGESGVALQIPAIAAGHVDVTNALYAPLDLSLVSTPELELNDFWQGNISIEWPTDVTSIRFDMCQFINGLPPFPATLEQLDFSNGLVDCIPLIPAGVHEIHFTPSFNLPCMPNWPAALEWISATPEDITEENAIYCSILNSSCPGGYPGIAGRLFVDADGDGVYDTSELPVPSGSISIQSGPSMVGTEADGTWDVAVQPGSYTITPSSSYPYLASFTPVEHTADLPNMGDTDTGNDFAATLIPDIADLRVSIHANVTRPGFDNQVSLTCQNYGTVPLDAELTLQFDGDQTWVGSSVAPTTQAGATATWNFPAMPIGTTQTITVDLNTAASVPLGTGIVHTLTASSTSTDETPLDNTRQWTDSVVGSFDPNDKLVAPTSMTPADVATGDTPLEYLIRFQNTGTFPAERVLILDTLPEGLVVESIEWLGSSHACHWYVTGGVLHVLHEHINLPDSTSDEPNSQGFVRFRIQPATDLIDGDEIINIAHIVFDFNAPVITPPSVFSVDISTGIAANDNTLFSVQPNPTRDRVRIAWPGAVGALPYAVHDVVGHLVLSGRADANGWIDLGGLATGTYLLRVEHAGASATQRLVKE